MLQTGGQAGTTPFMQLDATRTHVRFLFHQVYAGAEAHRGVQPGGDGQLGRFGSDVK